MFKVQENQNDRAIVFLAIWLAVSFLVRLLFDPGTTTPPGNVWRLEHTLTCIIVVFGAYLSAFFGVRRIFYFLYGVLASLFIMGVLLPDSRDMIGIAIGLESLEAYLARAISFVIALGVVCTVAAQVRLVQLKRAQNRGPRTRCEECGYLLYGLPEPRCPECGAPFESDETDTAIPSSSDDD